MGPRTFGGRVLEEFVPDAHEVTLDLRDQVGFVDQGANFENVRCPACGTALETDWWQAAMDKAMDSRFVDLSVTPPCCGRPTSLNDLRYEWPAGFARFCLEAMNPNVKDLDQVQVQKLEVVLGCKLRRIWAHY